MTRLEIRPITQSDEPSVVELLRQHWGDVKVVSRGRVHDAAKLPGFIAVKGDEVVGLVTLCCEAEACEVITLDAFVQGQGQGIGSALLKEAEQYAAIQGCTRLWLITTNDNLGALEFYQKRGFRMVAIYPDAVNEARKI